MATTWIASWTGLDLAKRTTSLSFYVDEADAQAWLADPTAAGDIKDLFDSINQLSGANEQRVSVGRREFNPLVQGIPGNEYRGNKVNISGRVTAGGAWTSSIPARQLAKFPVNQNSIEVATEGFDPVTYPDWQKYLDAVEGNVESEEGSAVSNIESARLND